MELGVDWKHPQTAQAAAGGGWEVGGKSPEAQAQSWPQSRSLLLSVPLSPPRSPQTHSHTGSQGVLRTAEDGDRLRGHGQRDPWGCAAWRPPQRCEREAEARGALSKARRPRPAPVAPPGARWPARAGTQGAAG